MPSPLIKPRLAICLLLCLAGRSFGQSPPERVLPTVPPVSGFADDKLPAGAVARLGTNRLRHGLWLHSLTYSSDGKTLVSCGFDDTIRFWDATTGRQLRILTGIAGIQSFALSASGKKLAAPLRSGSELVIRVFDLVTGAERDWKRGLAVPMCGFSEYAVTFTPDEKSVATTDDIGTVSLIDVATGQRTELGKHGETFVSSLAFAPGGTLLASCGGDGTVRLWDVTGRKAPQAFRAPVTRVCSVAFTPDGKRLIASGNTFATNPPSLEAEASAVWVWDVDTGKEVRTLPVLRPKESVATVSLSPDGGVLAVSTPRRLILWDLRADRPLRSLPPKDQERHYTTAAHFSPDGKQLAFGVGSVIRVWDTSSGRPVSPDPDDADGSADVLAFSTDGRFLAVRSFEGAVHVWDATSGRKLVRLHESKPGTVAVAVVPGSDLLAVLRGDGAVVLRGLASGGERVLPAPPPEGAAPGCLAASPDGRFLAAGFHSANLDPRPPFVWVWDLASATEPQRLEVNAAGRSWFSVIAFSSDGTTLAATVGPERFRWHSQRGRFATGEVLSRELHSSSIAFAPDGTLATAAWQTPGVTLLAAGADRVRKHLAGPDGVGRVLAFSPDGHYLVSAGGLLTGGNLRDARDQSIRVYELMGWQEVFRWEPPLGTAVRSAAFSPGGRHLVTGMTDSTILAWDLYPAGTGKCPDPTGLWEDLRSPDGRKAHSALSALVALGDRAVAVVADRVRPLHTPEPGHLARLIADLDSKSFAAREKAARELASLFETAWPALERARDSAASPEVRHRAEALLRNQGEDRPLPPEMLAAVRSVEVLERIGTPRAREALRALASGAPDARLTREAHAALTRLAAKGKK